MFLCFWVHYVNIFRPTFKSRTQGVWIVDQKVNTFLSFVNNMKRITIQPIYMGSDIDQIQIYPDSFGSNPVSMESKMIVSQMPCISLCFSSTGS